MDLKIFSRMMPVPFFYFIFKVKVLVFFLIWECFTKGERQNTLLKYYHQKFGYLPLNGATANVLDHDLDLHFQGHEFRNANISKMVRVNKKWSSMTFIEIIFVMLVNVVLCDLDLNFRFQTFQIAILMLSFS